MNNFDRVKSKILKQDYHAFTFLIRNVALTFDEISRLYTIALQSDNQTFVDEIERYIDKNGTDL